MVSGQAAKRADPQFDLFVHKIRALIAQALRSGLVNNSPPFRLRFFDQRLAIRAIANPADFHPHRFFNRLYIGARPPRQVRIGANATDVLFPAAHHLINRPGAPQLIRIQFIVMHPTAIQLVANANFDLLELAEHVQLGQEQAVDAVDLGRKAHQFSVEPAAASNAPGCDSYFAERLGRLGIVVDLGGHGATANAGGGGLGHANHRSTFSSR